MKYHHIVVMIFKNNCKCCLLGTLVLTSGVIILSSVRISIPGDSQMDPIWSLIRIHFGADCTWRYSALKADVVVMF